MVGSEGGSTTGRAFTDGGITHDYGIERDESRLTFADTAPDHSQEWVRARKVIEPTEGGDEERLEVDAGDGFATYYAISMRRT